MTSGLGMIMKPVVTAVIGLFIEEAGPGNGFSEGQMKNGRRVQDLRYEIVSLYLD